MPYDFLPFIFSAVFLVLGLMMFLSPQQCVKPEKRNSQADIKKAKSNGMIVIICAVVLFIITLLTI